MCSTDRSIAFAAEFSFLLSKGELPLQNSISMIPHLTKSYKCYSIKSCNSISASEMEKLKSLDNFLIKLCIKIWSEFSLHVISTIFGQTLLEYWNCILKNLFTEVWFTTCRGKSWKKFQWMITYMVNISTILKNIYWKVSIPTRANIQVPNNSLPYKNILLQSGSSMLRYLSIYSMYVYILFKTKYKVIIISTLFHMFFT